jgi:predicted DNA-binding transcriptional regulator YafY
VIWPLALGYFEMSRIVVAWCELRSDFRHFRTDRMHKAEVSRQRYRGNRAALLARWRAQAQAPGGAPGA